MSPLNLVTRDHSEPSVIVEPGAPRGARSVLPTWHVPALSEQMHFTRLFLRQEHDPGVHHYASEIDLVRLLKWQLA
jgi:hypothetical protein